ncbi:hypothetical protein C8F04DRAFT_1234048 [Mycena alexandri]|uniref:Uncharacterized protein n=1 Tax=Mycena alexandri TaxID=1745969 RepID=A0AAD6SXI8_9AGAR|nr:hypothetical protein C8F04DRAFT_1234048 [Mycena alexandri]
MKVRQIYKQPVSFIYRLLQVYGPYICAIILCIHSSIENAEAHEGGVKHRRRETAGCFDVNAGRPLCLEMPASTPIHSDALNYPVRLIDPRGPGDKMTNVQYEHPPLIKSQINAWTQSVNAAAVVTALFAGTAAQLFGIVISSSFNPGHTRSFLILSSYAAMIFNALATMASIVLIDRLGDIELHGATMEPTTPQTGVYRNVRNLELLLEYGARASFKYIFCQYSGAYVDAGGTWPRYSRDDCHLRGHNHARMERVATLRAGLKCQFNDESIGSGE